jgi:DNA-directed RNA polymerase alpha subunit
MTSDNDDLSPTPDAPWGWAISRRGTRYKRPRPRTEADKQAARRAMLSVLSGMGAEHLKQYPFRDRGLSGRTVEALIEFGMDAPERLLFMQESEIEKIPGIGKASVREIRSYRERFIGED